MPGEPFFGYLRGRYSVMEMAAIAEHARDLGVELIPAIQVLGHLEQLLHWPAFSHVRDTPSVLLAADDDPAFQLLVSSWKPAAKDSVARK